MRCGGSLCAFGDGNNDDHPQRRARCEVLPAGQQVLRDDRRIEHEVRKRHINQDLQLGRVRLRAHL